MADRIRAIRGYSGLVRDDIPSGIDFAFIDGDHSWEGIECDWQIVVEKLDSNGIVCFHDALIPQPEQWRNFGSTRYFDSVISKDARFMQIDSTYSLAVLRRQGV